MSRRPVPRKPVSRPIKKKEKPPKPPNFPQHNLQEPYSRLLELGAVSEDETFEEIAEELKAKDADAAAQKLVEMALDETYYDYVDFYPDFNDYMERETRMLTPSHAVRVLTFLGEAARIGIEPLLPMLNTEDDFLREEMPIYYGAMGRPAIAPLTRVLHNKENEFMRAGAGDSLGEIGEKHADLRSEIVSILEQTLANEQEDFELNGFLIGNLLDLGAVESMPIIQQAFEDERVDEFIVGLDEVQEHFGLPVTVQYEYPNPYYEGDAPSLPSLPDVPRLSEEGFLEPFEPVQQPYVTTVKAGRNDPCPCGSGKKYKKCCGA